MKAALVGLILIVALGIGGYIGYTKYLPGLLGQTAQPETAPTGEKGTKTMTETGILMKVKDPKDDYTHTLKTDEKLVRVASYTVKLDDYVGKKVTLTGQPSGTTLFADTVAEVK